HTLGDIDHAGEDRLERLAAANPFADRTVPPERAVAGRNQVANSGQPIEGGLMPTERHPQPADLDEPSRQQGGLGVIAKAQTVADARGDAQDVLQGTGQLDSHRVGIRVNPEGLVAEVLLDGLVELQRRSGDDDRGRQAAADLLGMAGTAEYRDRALCEDLDDDLAGPVERTVFD